MSVEAYREIIRQLLEFSSPSKKDLDCIKMKVAKKYSLNKVPSNAEIIQHLEPEETAKLIPVLRRKVVRTISGVTVVAVMTKPLPCPQDLPCAYCPGGPTSGSPQSYTGHEPAALRGSQNEYNPYNQVTNRIEQLEMIGHKVDKVELIVMGGTFPSTPREYQEDFVKQCLDAITRTKSNSLDEAKKLAENSKVRNVGITVETRPDWAKQEQVNQMLTMGVTRVELGVQNIYDDIYKQVNRGHQVIDVIKATQIMKDAGLKLVYHLMPGLPGSNFERDLDGFREVFVNPVFKPDMIKLYPCLVVKGTKVYDWWKKGEYQPYSTEEAAQLIAEVKKFVPPWVRIMRVQRDIPANLIEAGVKLSNLRQIALEILENQGNKCPCIRCREVGHRWLKDNVKPDLENIEIQTIKESASEGTELFISAEDPVNDVLLGYVRLRIPSEKAFRPEIASKKVAIVRELRVYGPLVPVGKHFIGAWQHKGYGNVLLSEAEKVAVEDFDRKKVVVISALGTKPYYMQLGYSYDGPYVSKQVN
ncbi:MAG: tRNA uridine(34) 5-carboxymethylaminomethyl modification radical SAM/GNAT enzyme Elp3 [Candidatus Bathyarchaeota archaeon]|nr:MAG: tRNA uridine(34) 5-carboxymethylaminomethyl modification radical SAM/GNAT enzyme Elp3 [Candidatus Bathyarchaeota archaeon]